MAIAIDARAPRAGGIPVRHVAAVVIGNALEFYDFLTYAFFAVYIGRAFFPGQTESTKLLLSLATFGAGFLMRPVGGIVIGRMGDRRGRRPAMILSLMLMGVAITGLALTPSYAAIGIAAPILVLCFRLLQGFALGGQVGPATAYLIEAAPPLQRGFYASLQYASQDFAVLCAGLIGVGLASVMNDQQLQDYGWRIAMLIGACIVPFGLLLRRALPETHANARSAETAHRRVAVRPFARLIVLTIMMLAAGTIATYSIDYLTTYALDTLKMPARLAFGATVINGLISMFFEPVSGLLSDRFGRKPLMIVPGIAFLLAIFPAFYMMNAFRSAGALYGGTAILGMLLALTAPSMLTCFAETVPPNIRAGAIAIVYAFTISSFGGTTQFVVKALLDWTGDPLAPAWYMSGAFVIGMIAVFMMKESAPIKTGISKGRTS